MTRLTRDGIRNLAKEAARNAHDAANGASAKEAMDFTLNARLENDEIDEIPRMTESDMALYLDRFRREMAVLEADEPEPEYGCLRALHLDFPELAAMHPINMLELAAMLVRASGAASLKDQAALIDSEADLMRTEHDRRAKWGN